MVGPILTSLLTSLVSQDENWRQEPAYIPEPLLLHPESHPPLLTLLLLFLFLLKHTWFQAGHTGRAPSNLTLLPLFLYRIPGRTYGGLLLSFLLPDTKGRVG